VDKILIKNAFEQPWTRINGIFGIDPDYEKKFIKEAPIFLKWAP
jgi:hypothetical protein